jgi:hypothetical protein
MAWLKIGMSGKPMQPYFFGEHIQLQDLQCIFLLPFSVPHKKLEMGLPIFSKNTNCNFETTLDKGWNGLCHTLKESFLTHMGDRLARPTI